jgi:hypothetical protein
LSAPIYYSIEPVLEETGRLLLLELVFDAVLKGQLGVVLLLNLARVIGLD